MHGRYPDYDVLPQADHWDEVTRRMVLARVDDVPEIRFFTAGFRRSVSDGGFTMSLAYAQQGDAVPATAWFERNRTACGPPGLLTEEYDVRQR
jgi:hypothetical protein